MRNILSKRHLVFKPWFEQILSINPIVLVDIGARGGIESPWKEMESDTLKVIGFEPDTTECARLSANNPSHIYIPRIVWSENKELSINITQLPVCSSIYEPNIEYLKIYEPKHWEQRHVVKKILYPATTIDEVSRKNKFTADFLKIDTQGSEFEILKGARHSLENDVFAVIAETWLVPVYKDQPMCEDIISYMRDRGFTLFDTNVAAAWRRLEGKGLTRGKKQVVGLDLLFFKEYSSNLSQFDSSIKILKAAAIAEMYGFPDFAISLIENALGIFPSEKKVLMQARDEIKALSKKSSFLTRLSHSFRRRLGWHVILEYPKLHT